MYQKAKFAFKGANLDISRLRQAGAELGDVPGTVVFKTPAGHTVTTPYSEDMIKHHRLRGVGENQYYADLADAIKRHADEVDVDVENRRDREVTDTRLSRAIFGGLAGGGLGAILGATVKRPHVGGLLGALGGGYLGHQAHVDRKSGPSNKETVREIAQLYSEPAHIKEMRTRIDNLRDEIDDDARFRHTFGSNYYPGFLY